MEAEKNRADPLVLVADDDPTIRLLASEMLQQAGFEVLEAENGSQAIDVFARFHPEVVLLDVMMPQMDGYVVCTSIRSLPAGEHAAIIMVTGLEDIESIHRAYDAGATDFITKPINWTILGHRVRYMWRASAARMDLQRSEEKTRALVDAMPDLMFQIGRDGTVLDCKVPRDFQPPLPQRQLVGRKIGEIPLFDDAQTALRQIEWSLRTG
ncbi:MAG: response regulator, partial [Syntrophobacteraceae bacterium]|nr:response regulator [Syntrophobacteraceae bacterium]